MSVERLKSLYVRSSAPLQRQIGPMLGTRGRLFVKACRFPMFSMGAAETLQAP